MSVSQSVKRLCLLLALLLSACGGGGGDTQAGINGSGFTSSASNSDVAVGPITAFGSIFVNGVEFDIGSNTTVTIDGVESANKQSDLRIGQVVEVRGSINTTTGKGTANSVAFDDNVQGVASNINATAGSFTVMNQAVVVTGATVFDGVIDLADLATRTNPVVEVSGYLNSAGAVQATRVELKTGSSASISELTGVVSALSGSTFNIGSTSVNVSGLSVAVSGLANGVCIEVKGSYSGSVLMASSASIKSCTLTTSNGQRGEIEGLVTSALTGTSLKVGNVNVDVGTSGVNAGLLLGVQVEVEGTFNATGVLVASKIEIKQGTDTRLTGVVDSINTTSKALTVLGVPVSVTTSTTWVDNSSAKVASFGLTALNVGDYVEVRGYENVAHTGMTAVTVERRNAGTRLELRGIARPLIASDTALTSPSFLVMGSTITTINGTTQFKDGSGSSVSQATFFGSTSGVINDRVYVRSDGLIKWNSATRVLSADRVEVEAVLP